MPCASHLVGWTEIAEGKVVGILSFVNREMKGASDALIELEHQYANNIVATTHVHLTKDLCLEVAVAMGYARTSEIGWEIN